MDFKGNAQGSTQWKLIEKTLLVTVYIFLLAVQCNCQTIPKDSSQIESITKIRVNNVDSKLESNYCHSCHNSSRKLKNKSTNEGNTNNITNDESKESFIDKLATTISEFTENYIFVNKTQQQMENELENLIDNAMKRDRYEIIKGIEIKVDSTSNMTEVVENMNEGRGLFSKYTYEYRLLQKVKNFINTHVVSIDLPKMGSIDFRSFGLKKFLLPIIIGIQIFKSMIFAMFLPSILGSVGKILGKGISHLSAASSQASYPPANADEPTAYGNDNKDMGYDADQAASFAYPQDGVYPADGADANDLSNIDMSRFSVGGQKVSYLPTKNSYYKNQIAAASNQYKVFQKIPASSVILSNYDPFYSPLLSRLDAIFARLGLLPSDNSLDHSTPVGGQSLSDVKLEACREQLVCLMYSSPAKYAPYSNLISAQLSRELNELRRPVSDNPEILRFFRYMRAARRGQEGVDCARAHPACRTNTAPAHTMIAAYNDLNKLVTARKLGRT